MTPKRYRTIVRWTHLALSGVLGTYVYSPWNNNPLFHGAIQWMIFPLLAVTGLALWKQAWILRRLSARTEITHARPAGGGL